VILTTRESLREGATPICQGTVRNHRGTREVFEKPLPIARSNMHPCSLRATSRPRHARRAPTCARVHSRGRGCASLRALCCPSLRAGDTHSRARWAEGASGGGSGLGLDGESARSAVGGLGRARARARCARSPQAPSLAAGLRASDVLRHAPLRGACLAPSTQLHAAAALTFSPAKYSLGAPPKRSTTNTRRPGCTSPRAVARGRFQAPRVPSRDDFQRQQRTAAQIVARFGHV